MNPLERTGIPDPLSGIKPEEEDFTEELQCLENSVESQTPTTSSNLPLTPSKLESNNNDTIRKSPIFFRIFDGIRSRPPSPSSEVRSSPKPSSDDLKNFYSFSKSKFPQINLSREQITALTPSKDQGGHGGTFKGPLTLEGTTHQVFLKPFDGVETKNYELIQSKSPKLSEFMPKIHGLTTIGKKQFLIMENTRISGDGNELKQYGDIKIAGKVKGLDNLIADQEEMLATRGKKKSYGDYTQMKAGANKAPGFLFYKDDPVVGAVGRFLHFPNSKENLHKKLKEAKPTEAQLLKLASKITKLQSCLKDSGIALIGGSVIIIQDEQGNLHPKLIDPAHVQYDPSSKENSEDQRCLFLGTEEKFLARRESNTIGLTDLYTAILDLANSPKK